MAQPPNIVFGDAATLQQNLSVFSAELMNLNGYAGPLLVSALPQLIDGAYDKDDLLDRLLTSITTAAASTNTKSVPPAAASMSAHGQPEGWFLESIEIEGFRGINNEGTPLQLKFKTDAVNSVSAPNGVGKSSIYDSLSFALRGRIPKLDRLLQSERPQDYYLNKFHPGGVGKIILTLRSDISGHVVPLTVTRNTAGIRNVIAPNGVDGKTFLKQLDREFVLLDGVTFQTFIEEKSLDRGRSFSGLLGLSKYSELRQQLQALSNTVFFNRHFDVQAHKVAKEGADQNATTARLAIAKDYEILMKEAPNVGASQDFLQNRCHEALHSIAVIRKHCANLPFLQLDVDACVATIQTEEGGEKRTRLSSVLQEHSEFTGANPATPSAEDADRLLALIKTRDEALEKTAGDLLHKLYAASQNVLTQADWSETLCPTCERDDGTSILAKVRDKLNAYQAVKATTDAVDKEWTDRKWGGLATLEKLCLKQGETSHLRQLLQLGGAVTLTIEQVTTLKTHIADLRDRSTTKIAALAAEQKLLEQELPPSLVAVTTAVETARRLQINWKALGNAEAKAKKEKDRAAKVSALKSFLDSASTIFAHAESTMAAARLKKVEPLCRGFFKDIMFSPVVPALQKREGSEELGIRLADFWGLPDQSAQALLSESFRNAFAISVYLAAASLYGGAARFIVLDDVTSSLDAGHQHHLMEVVRTRFARPIKGNGPQVVFLSHDTLLEKLFNKHSGTPAWHHQRLEGNARTAVLPQSGAVNKVRDTTIDLLNAGRIDDAAPRIRQYLEYTLHNIVDRCRIPLPLDLVFGDEKRTAGEYITAISAALDLERRAASLVLDTAQIADFQTHEASIVGNFLAHWSSGQAHAFSAPALLGVMHAIDKLHDCFKYEPTPGATKKFYSSLHKR